MKTGMFLFISVLIFNFTDLQYKVAHKLLSTVIIIWKDNSQLKIHTFSIASAPKPFFKRLANNVIHLSEEKLH